MLEYPLRAARALSPAKIAVVVGHGAAEVQRACKGEEVIWVQQNEQLGTGHAVLCTKKSLADFPGHLLILNGDVPLITVETLRRLLGCHRDKRPAVTLLTALLDDPSGYGRVVRDHSGRIVRVVEDKDARGAEKSIREVNSGVYVVSPDFLFPALEKLPNQNQQGEFYLTDIVSEAAQTGVGMEGVCIEEPWEIRGINTREELAIMERYLQEKINRHWMESGVTLQDPQTTYIEEGVEIGKDTVIGPNTHLKGRTVVGERCLIDGSAYVMDSRIGRGVHVKFSSAIFESDLGDEAQVGPFAHLRPGTQLGTNVHIGSFVEVKNSTVGEGTKANHLSYIGDAAVGKDSNIGAGTITCNYDGFDKHRTTIGDRVQVGSHTQLVAPVVVEDDAYIAAGSTITRDVPAGVLALSRVAQRHVNGWVERFRQMHKKK